MAPKAKQTVLSSKAVIAETPRGGSSAQETPISGKKPSGLTSAIKRVYGVSFKPLNPPFESEPSTRARAPVRVFRRGSEVDK